MARWTPVCQWCGKSGCSTNLNDRPSHNPSISGNCPSHPSGNSNAPHGPQWVQD